VDTILTNSVIGYSVISVPAGVYAVGGSMRVSRGSDILLACPHVGDPKPTAKWTRWAIDNTEMVSKGIMLNAN